MMMKMKSMFVRNPPCQKLAPRLSHSAGCPFVPLYDDDDDNDVKMVMMMVILMVMVMNFEFPISHLNTTRPVRSRISS